MKVKMNGKRNTLGGLTLVTNLVWSHTELSYIFKGSMRYHYKSTRKNKKPNAGVYAEQLEVSDNAGVSTKWYIQTTLGSSFIVSYKVKHEY